MNLDPTILLSGFKAGTVLYVKVALLVLIVLYALFTIMLATKIRSLDKTVFLPSESGEGIIKVFSILYVLVVLSLFIATLVIV